MPKKIGKDGIFYVPILIKFLEEEFYKKAACLPGFELHPWIDVESISYVQGLLIAIEKKGKKGKKIPVLLSGEEYVKLDSSAYAGGFPLTLKFLICLYLIDIHLLLRVQSKMLAGKDLNDYISPIKKYPDSSVKQLLDFKDFLQALGDPDAKFEIVITKEVLLDVRAMSLGLASMKEKPLEKRDFISFFAKDKFISETGLTELSIGELERYYNHYSTVEVVFRGVKEGGITFTKNVLDKISKANLRVIDPSIAPKEEVIYHPIAFKWGKEASEPSVLSASMLPKSEDMPDKGEITGKDRFTYRVVCSLRSGGFVRRIPVKVVESILAETPEESLLEVLNTEDKDGKTALIFQKTRER